MKTLCFPFLFAALVLAGCSTPAIPPPAPVLVSSPAGNDLRTVGLGFSAACPDLLVVQTPPPKPTYGQYAAAVAVGVAAVPVNFVARGALPAIIAVDGIRSARSASKGVSKKELAAATAALEAANKDLRLHEDFARALLEKVPEIAGRMIQTIPGLVAAAKARPTEPATPGGSEPATQIAAPTPYPLPPAGIDTMLRLRVLQCSLHGQEARNPPLKLGILIEAQLIRTGDWSDTGRFFASFEGGERPFTVWAAANARALREEWRTAVDSLAAQTAAWLSGGAVPPPAPAQTPAPSSRPPSS